MSATQPFNPRWGSNQQGTATDPAVSLIVAAKTKQLHIENTGGTSGGTTGILYVRTWNTENQSAIAAAATDLRVSVGTVEVITKPEDDDRVSVFSATTATYAIMEGEGW